MNIFRLKCIQRILNLFYGFSKKFLGINYFFIKKEAKFGNLNNMEKILGNYQNKNKILNDLGSGGWNILHFAIFCGHIDIVKKLIEL